MKINKLDGKYVYQKTPHLSWSEISYGLERGFIDESAASVYACERLGAGSSPEVIELASLTPEQLFSARSILRYLSNNEEEQSTDFSRPWIFLLLSFAFENRNLFDDPFEYIEELYVEFDYPENLAGAARYMPVPDGLQGSDEYLLNNWKKAICEYGNMLDQSPKKDE